jgi:hypothetical protein
LQNKTGQCPAKQSHFISVPLCGKKYKTNPNIRVFIQKSNNAQQNKANVGEASTRLSSQKSVLHFIKNAKQTQFPSWVAARPPLADRWAIALQMPGTSNLNLEKNLTVDLQSRYDTPNLKALFTEISGTKGKINAYHSDCPCRGHSGSFFRLFRRP